MNLCNLKMNFSKKYMSEPFFELGHIFFGEINKTELKNFKQFPLEAEARTVEAFLRRGFVDADVQGNLRQRKTVHVAQNYYFAVFARQRIDDADNFKLCFVEVGGVVHSLSFRKINKASKNV